LSDVRLVPPPGEPIDTYRCPWF